MLLHGFWWWGWNDCCFANVLCEGYDGLVTGFSAGNGLSAIVYCLGILWEEGEGVWWVFWNCWVRFLKCLCQQQLEQHIIIILLDKQKEKVIIYLKSYLTCS